MGAKFGLNGKKDCLIGVQELLRCRNIQRLGADEREIVGKLCAKARVDSVHFPVDPRTFGGNHCPPRRCIRIRVSRLLGKQVCIRVPTIRQILSLPH